MRFILLSSNMYLHKITFTYARGLCPATDLHTVVSTLCVLKETTAAWH